MINVQPNYWGSKPKPEIPESVAPSPQLELGNTE